MVPTWFHAKVPLVQDMQWAKLQVFDGLFNKVNIKICQTSRKYSTLEQYSKLKHNISLDSWTVSPNGLNVFPLGEISHKTIILVSWGPDCTRWEKYNTWSDATTVLKTFCTKLLFRSCTSGTKDHYHPR